MVRSGRNSRSNNCISTKSSRKTQVSGDPRSKIIKRTFLSRGNSSNKPKGKPQIYRRPNT